MAQIARKLWNNGFKIYFAFCLLSFTLLILLINVTRVFGAETPVHPVKSPAKETQAAPVPNILPRNLFHWTLASGPKTPETSMEFRGNKMLFKVSF